MPSHSMPFLPGSAELIVGLRYLTVFLDSKFFKSGFFRIFFVLPGRPVIFPLGFDFDLSF